MIYECPKVWPLGDSYVAVEFGDEASLELSFRVLALMTALAADPIGGTVDIVPTLRTLAIVFDPTCNRYERITAELLERVEGIDPHAKLRSRRFVLPVWYNDPWSRSIAEKNSEPFGCEVVAELNGLSTIEEVIARHTATDHWCACVGWGPGCYFCYPMDPACVLSAPKLRTPREFCNARMLNMGGTCTAAMPVDGPSGYTMLGRLAVDIYDPEGRNAGFPENGVLFRAGDRHRYRSVSGDEYEEIYARVLNGSYEYEVTEEDFDPVSYLDSVTAAAG